MHTTNAQDKENLEAITILKKPDHSHSAGFEVCSSWLEHCCSGQGSIDFKYDLSNEDRS